jgi:hypothetical protein
MLLPHASTLVTTALPGRYHPVVAKNLRKGADMRKSPFWRIVAVVGVLGLLYVGHGLHNGGNEGLPSIVNTARAGGVSVSTSNGAHNIYTASEDGRILYLWANSGDGKPKFVAEANASDLPIDHREKTDGRALDFGPKSEPQHESVPFQNKKPSPDSLVPPGSPKGFHSDNRSPFETGRS